MGVQTFVREDVIHYPLFLTINANCNGEFHQVFRVFAERDGSCFYCSDNGWMN
jgi:hypothetical protein